MDEPSDLGSGAGEITSLLREWRHGDRAALDRLMALVHDELRSLARRHLRGERLAATLQPTALVNEAYLRLVGASQVPWEDRAHFFGVASRLMRQVLVDHARTRLLVVQGDVLDVTSLQAAIQGQEAVLSALGHRRYFHPTRILSEETANILTAMETNRVRRFVCETSLGIGDSAERMGVY